MSKTANNKPENTETTTLKIRVIDGQDGKPVFSLVDTKYDLAISPDGLLTAPTYPLRLKQTPKKP